MSFFKKLTKEFETLKDSLLDDKDAKKDKEGKDEKKDKEGKGKEGKEGKEGDKIQPSGPHDGTDLHQIHLFVFYLHT